MSEFDRLGVAKVAGIDGTVIGGILRASGQSAAHVCPFRTKRNCRVKTAVVPTACAGQRRTAWAGGFFGEEAVVPTAPYLGCALTSPWFEDDEGRP
eukprot:11865517-Alexandrium_andersonii.AAC.1